MSFLTSTPALGELKNPASRHQTALDAANVLFGKWAANVEIDAKQKITVDTLDQSLKVLLGPNGEHPRTLLLAICETAAQDGRLSVVEGKLIRVICASLVCPLPPILADN